MTQTNDSTGRAGAVFVFGRADSARAVVSAVTVQVVDDDGVQRIDFCGSGTFDDHAMGHINTLLLPMVDFISEGLGIGRRNFRISIANPGGTAIHDLGIEVAGYSADVPVFLAMLSATLGMSISEAIVSTGHIASSAGDVAAVQAISEKLAAALDDTTADTFIYPDLKADQSLGQLSPAEKEKAEIAVINAKGQIKLTAVSTIADLISAVFTDQAIVMSSLEQGFFQAESLRSNDAITRSLHYLTDGNEKRFWGVLEQQFLAGSCDQAKGLLRARLNYQMNQKIYPKQFGRMLLQLLRSLPPTIRKLAIDFPLFGVLDGVKLSQFATESDSADIRLLQDAAEGKNLFLDPPVRTAPAPDSETQSANEDEAAVDRIISQIDAKGLAEAIGIPIDTARATYRLDSLTVRSDEQFFETIAAFYLHLKRHISSSVQLADDGTVRADSVGLIERAFRDKGGLKAAMTEAAEAIHGGMKFILDAMTEQFRAQRQAAHVNQIIKQAISPLDVNAQLSFIRVLLKRLSPHLPAEIVASPPDRFVDHYEDIVKEYVKSLDRINEVFGKY